VQVGAAPEVLLEGTQPVAGSKSPTRRK